MLKIGWASADVSTNGPVGIMGQAHLRISNGSHDPTTLTALYLSDGKDCVVFVSGDFTSIQSDLFHEIKEQTEKRLPGFDSSKLIFNATHTHTAPRYHLTTGYDLAPKDRVDLEPPEKYRAFLVEQAVQTIIRAHETASPGSIAYGYGSAAIGLQRRVNYFHDRSSGNTSGNTFAVNGRGVMYGKTDDPDFSGFEATTDTNVYLLYTFDETDALTGAVINVPCPSQCTEQEYFTSADYWHETRQLIRETYGNIFILPQCAAAGDLSPHPLHNQAAIARRVRLRYGDDPNAAAFQQPFRYYNRRYIAEKLARAFDEGYSWASLEKFNDLPIVHITKTVELERWNITQQQYEEAKESLAHLQKIPFQHTEDPYEDFQLNTRQSSELSRCESVIARYENKAETVATEIHAVRLGDVAFTTCPFELYIDYQHRIQARSPFVQTFVVELAASDEQESYGYLATERAVQNKGYSAISYSCFVSPTGGQTLVEELLHTLKELHS